MNVTNWPLYGLRLRTPRLELRLPTVEELDALGELSARGVHDPVEMPFAVPWSDLPPAERARSVMQFHWHTLATWSADDWTLQLVVFLDGTVVGTQSLLGRDFPILRQVSSGSWLGQAHQRRGIGTEMRAAVLHLAFAGLNAESAITSALVGNPASAAVSRRLGYREGGVTRVRVRDALGHDQHFALDRPGWDGHRTVKVEIDGLEPCLPRFGL